MFFYTGSSRQLRKFKHQLLKAGFTNSDGLSYRIKNAFSIALFKHSRRFCIIDWETDQKPDIIYTGRQYKQALQALNIPL